MSYVPIAEARWSHTQKGEREIKKPSPVRVVNMPPRERLPIKIKTNGGKK